MKKYRCECGKRFTQSKSLKSHKKHCGNESIGNILENRPEVELFIV